MSRGKDSIEGEYCGNCQHYESSVRACKDIEQTYRDADDSACSRFKRKNRRLYVNVPKKEK